MGSDSVVSVLAAWLSCLHSCEFFALGEHAGLHGYRIWTGFCALAMLFPQWLASAEQSLGIASGTRLGRVPEAAEAFSLEMILIVFVLGIAVIILFGRQPVDESLGGISVSSAAMLFLVLPFSAVVRLHGSGPEDANCALHFDAGLGRRHTRLLCWQVFRAHAHGAAIEPRENMGGRGRKLAGFGSGLACCPALAQHINAHMVVMAVGQHRRPGG